MFELGLSRDCSSLQVTDYCVKNLVKSQTYAAKESLSCGAASLKLKKEQKDNNMNT